MIKEAQKRLARAEAAESEAALYAAYEGSRADRSPAPAFEAAKEAADRAEEEANQARAALKAARESNKEGSQEMKTGNCAKCGGSGNIRAFSHIRGGDCFACGATGKMEIRASQSSDRPAEDLPAMTVEVDGGNYILTRTRVFSDGSTVEVYVTSEDKTVQGSMWVNNKPEFSDALKGHNQGTMTELARRVWYKWVRQ